MAALNAAKASTAVVVLGQSLNPDGSYPATLSARVRAAADILSRLSSSTPASSPLVILSGGNAAGVGMSEARCMLELLFPGSLKPTPEVLLEENSLTTCRHSASTLQLPHMFRPTSLDSLRCGCQLFAILSTSCWFLGGATSYSARRNHHPFAV